MKKLFVKDLEVSSEITDFFMIKSFDIKQDRNGKRYLDITLSDMTGEINGKKWDIEQMGSDEISKLGAGKIMKIKAEVTEWRDTKQLKIMKIRFANESDEINKRDFIKAAPENPKDMYEFILSTIDDFEDEELKKLCKSIYEDNKDKIMYYPAAMSNHHAEYAGLLWHIKRMLKAGIKMCEVYTNLNRDLLLAGIAIHDIEKLNEIESDENGISPGYSFEGQMIGHIVQGVRMVHNRSIELGIGYEKMILLEHMILSHHYEPEFGSPKRPLFPEAEMLHHLDNIDAKMFDMEESLMMTEEGKFGEKIWTLDNRRIYKKKF